MPPKPAPTGGGKNKINLAEIVVPRWLKEEALAWVEIYDSNNIVVEGYSMAQVVEVNNDTKKAKLKYSGKETGPEEVLVSNLLERSEEPQVNDDLVDIEPLNDAELLRCLEIRFKMDKIYCFCGPSLLSTNPYKSIPNPDAAADLDLFRKYALSGGKRIPKPHIYNMTAIVFWQLIETKKKQAICISGESGAGKSHSTRMCLEFITQLFSDKVANKGDSIEDKIMSCNPILESFGNAKTIRNNDSSRFGKYFLLYVDLQGKQIKGSKIENYLLEKSRVVNQAETERNYHIFYAVCKNMTAEEQVKYLFTDSGQCDMSKYPFLSKSGCYSVQEIEDDKIYEDVVRSFNKLGFDADEKESIWKILSIILNLSNVEIDTSTYEEASKSCSLKDSLYLQRVLKLLEIDKEKLQTGLCYKKIGTGDLRILTPTQCEGVKDALAKDFFNSTFSWMVRKLNLSLLPPDSSKYSTVGVLDIFGFEDFLNKNSMEQLCINYTNEKLQKLYILCVFEAEKKIFIEEGLGNHSDKIKTNENTEVLKLFESPTGLFQLVDSACNVNPDNQKAETALINSLWQQHEKNPIMFFDKLKKHLFSIRHTAKKVTYSAENFPEKNRDELPMNLYEAIGAGNKVIYRIFKQAISEDELKQEDKSGQKKKTLVSKFKLDMTDLMDTLESSGCNFIRCLKPNEDKIKDVWNPILFLTQIKYMGILDSIKVRRDSFPLRRQYKDFYTKYQDLDAISPERNQSIIRLNQKANVDWKKLCENVVKSIEAKTPKNQVLFGKTRIFLNIVYVNRLEELLDEVQKVQRVALNKIGDNFQAWMLVNQWNRYRKASLKVLGLSKTLLITWNSKIEYVKFKSILRITLHAQHRFRFTKYRRKGRLEKYAASVIGRSYQLYKMREIISNARKRLQMISSVVMKMRFKLFMIRIRINKGIMDSIVDKAWVLVKQRMTVKSCENIQRIWRGHLNRIKYLEDFKKLNTVRDTIIKNRAVKTIGRYTRGFLVRARLDRMDRAAGYIQGWLRSRVLSKYLSLVKEATRVIQKVFRKYILRNWKIKQAWSEFSKNNKEFISQIKAIEHDVVFHREGSFYSLQNLDSYTKVKFFEAKTDFREFIPKNVNFICPEPAIDLNPKMRLFSILIDFDCFVDTSDIYKRSWAVDFLNDLEGISQKSSRMLHLEVGDTFTLAVDDDLKLHGWGLNDRHQLARPRAVQTSSEPGQIKKFSNIAPRIVSCGDDHTLMVDYSNDLYVWGSNLEGQFGLGHPRTVQGVVHLKTFGNHARYIAAKGKTSFLVTDDGRMYQWPNHDLPESMYVPILCPVSEPQVKFSLVSCGRNFTIALSTSGVVFSSGSNKYGQLGTGDTTDRKTFYPIETLRSYGEKISEISCGYSHTICKTHSSKVYTWGYGGTGQLGTGQQKSSTVPIYIKTLDPGSLTKARSVQAGALNSWVLMENGRLFHTGQLSRSDHVSLAFENFDFVSKVFGSKLNKDFIPLKLYSKWSKSLSLTYLVISDFRRVKVTSGIRDKIADQVSEKWEEVYNQMLPPFTEAIYKNICPKYTRKINPVRPTIASEISSSAQTHKGPSKDLTLTLNPADRSKSRILSSNTNKENTSKMRAGDTTIAPKTNPYDMSAPGFDRSYENLLSMRTRLEKLMLMDEANWTTDDRLLVSTLNRSRPN